MKVQVNGGTGFSHDVNLNPRGLHENSGVHQWENETLIAIQWLPTTSGKCRVVELPARATVLHTTRRRFTSAEQAKDYIKEQWQDRAITVQPEDITEEIGRRKALEAREKAMDDRVSPSVRAYPPVECPETERLSWGL